MRVIDKIKNSLKDQGVNSSDVEAILYWIEQLGGVKSISSRFEIAGFGPLIDSWISKKENSEINSGQIQDVFGMEDLHDLATTVGHTLGGTAEMLASSLPAIIDQLTSANPVKGNQRGFLRMLQALMGKLFG